MCCPFPHVLENAPNQVYYEQRPSAHVNISEKLFHCKACGRGYNEISFTAALLGMSYINAMRIAEAFECTNEDRHAWETEVTLSAEVKQRILELGISEPVITELNIRETPDNQIAFPVFLYDKLIDIRTYQPGGRPKVRSRANAPQGLIIPYDIWKETPDRRWTLICAGEKDMAVARSHGFNAITLTGGETMLPIILEQFKGRRVCIAYDNDATGKTGASKLAAYLTPYAEEVRVCTGFHDVCKEDKEDLTDFFVKYGKNKADLIHYIEAAPVFIESESAINTHAKVSLLTASQAKYIGRTLYSNIQVVATTEGSFVMPTAIIGKKYRASDKAEDDRMFPGQIKTWEYTPDTAKDILHLIDNNFTEKDLQQNYKNLLKILQKERYIAVSTPVKQTVFKCYITDMFETNSTDAVPMEYTAYSVGTRLESGKKYLATYQLVPHPYKGQQLTMLILSVKQANDSVSNFKLTQAVKENLQVIQSMPGTVPEKIDNLTERFKSVLGYNGNNTLIQAVDLSYNTVLQFHFGQFKNVRGFLDTIVVGESRMGKSSTADALRNLYQLGTFISLAGNAATVPGLIGGSNKVSGTFQTRAGAIPQNHKGLIIFEELGKCSNNLIKELTDIRSSNEVRITRVSGTLTLPAMVRMVTLTNVKTSEGVIKPIAAYPNGISILTELVGTAEDIARYDIALILGDPGPNQTNPFWQAPPHLPEEVYRTRVRWIWSRTPEQVIIPDDVGQYLVTQANRLNEIYGGHIKIFGPEAWKKIARLAIAVAGYLVSTDETYENLIVHQDHVDFAVNFLVDIYDNPIFKLKEYVFHERRFSTIDEEGVLLLQDIYLMAPAMLQHLEQVAQTSKNALQAATGLDNDKYNSLMNRLVSGYFVQFSKYDILPTERFRIGMSQINRNTRVRRVGE